MKILMCAFLFGVTLLRSCPAPAQTTPLYATDFESPQFSLATLPGQQNFIAYEGKNVGAARVIGTSASSGTRCVQIKGTNVGIYADLDQIYAGYYYPPLNYNPILSNRPRAILRSDMAFFANGTTVSTNAGVQLYQSDDNLIAGILVNDTGLLIGFNDDAGPGNQVSRPITFGVYHTLTLYADYASQMTEFYVDGDSLGSVPFSRFTGDDLADFDLFYSGSEGQPNADVNFDAYSAEVASAGSTLVTGQVDVQALSSVGFPTTFTFRPGAGAPFTRNAVLSANGTFTLGGIPAGTYSVLVHAALHLNRAFDLTANGTTVSNLRLQLLAGDINGDNAIDFGDLSQLLQFYNTIEGDPLYSSASDINLDGGIDFGDLSLMLQNYNAFGDD